MTGGYMELLKSNVYIVSVFSITFFLLYVLLEITYTKAFLKLSYYMKKFLAGFFGGIIANIGIF